MEIQKLTDSDIRSLNEMYNTRTIIGYSIMWVLTSFFFGLIGLIYHRYFETVAVVFVLGMLPYLYNEAKKKTNYKKDLKTLEKICATITITKKFSSWYSTNLKELKTIYLFSKNLREPVIVGDFIYVEITKEGKTILKLEKNGKSLFWKNTVTLKDMWDK